MKRAQCACRSNRRLKVHPAALAAALALAPVPAAFAAAVTDGSMGAVQTLSGAFVVPQALGQVRGANLFHSFASFSIAAGESATFQAGAGIGNVISRVTGGQPSVLQGPLALQATGGSTPNFFFVNPSGITVGAGATFDVPAGLHLSTAPQLRFADGTVWATGSTAASTLTVAAPESFGFLGTGSAGALRWAGGGAVVAQGSTLELAGGSIAVEGAQLIAPGGQLRLSSPGAIAITEGAVVAAPAGVLSGVGLVTIDAASLSVSGNETLATIVVSQTGPGATGGGIRITLSGALTVSRGARISHRGFSATDNGSIVLRAGSATLSADEFFASIETIAFGTAAGPGLRVEVPGRLELAGGDITTFSNNAAGRAGDLQVSAGSIRLDGQGFLGYGAISSQTNPSGGGAPGAVQVTSAGALDLVGAGSIGSTNGSAGAAGAVQVQARSATLAGQGTLPSAIEGLNVGAGRGAAVSVTVSEALTLRPGGHISAATLGSGAAGDVTVQADQLALQGRPGSSTTASAVTGIFSNSLTATAGAGGTVNVTGNRVTMTGNAQISTTTLDSAAGAGDVRVVANDLLMDGQRSFAGIASSVLQGPGNAGLVRVEVRNALTLLNGGTIEASSLGTGSPGNVVVSAGTLRADGRDAGTSYTGIGGDGLGGGAGAPVLVRADRVELFEGGAISSSAFGARDGGSVTVRAGQLLVDGRGNRATVTGVSARTSGAGNAGSVLIEAGDVQVVDAGAIGAGTLGAGRGGLLRVDADSLLVARGGLIESVAGGSGAAGLLDLRVRGAMRLEEGGVIAASTGGAGAAGRINVQAGTLTIQGRDAADGQRSRIASTARASSAGDAGAIAIDVAGDFTMGPGGLLNIANDAQVAGGAAPPTPSFVRVQAGRIVMQGAEITAASSANADAGGIALLSQSDLKLGNSLLRTTAFEGDGGPISLTAGLAAPGVVTLRNTSVTTSVDGAAGGDGGNIRITGNALVLASGFVQGNTLAAQASGGNVTIDAPLLVPDGDNVFVGGSRIALFRANQPGYNVIQAAAPNGLAGTLDVTRPELNLAGALAALSTVRIDFGLLGRDMCRFDEGSSFTPLGRGALPPTGAEPLGVRR